MSQRAAGPFEELTSCVTVLQRRVAARIATRGRTPEWIGGSIDAVIHTATGFSRRESRRRIDGRRPGRMVLCTTKPPENPGAVLQRQGLLNHPRAAR